MFPASSEWFLRLPQTDRNSCPLRLHVGKFQQDDNSNNQWISWTAADKLGPTDSAESSNSSSVELLRNSVAALARVTHQPREGETDRGVLTPAYEQFMGFISGSCDEAFLDHRSKNVSQTHVWVTQECWHVFQLSPQDMGSSIAVLFVQEPTSSISGVVVQTAGNCPREGWGLLSPVAFHFNS